MYANSSQLKQLPYTNIPHSDNQVSAPFNHASPPCIPDICYLLKIAMSIATVTYMNILLSHFYYKGNFACLLDWVSFEHEEVDLNFLNLHLKEIVSLSI